MQLTEKDFEQLTDAQIAALYDLAALDAEAPPVSLAAFVEGTTRHKLDPWQYDLCGRLETLAHTTGRRVLIAAPPQTGKSIIVSQRFPAWLLARKPTNRVKLACYNITHAARFGRIVRDLMQSHEYLSSFPDPELRVPALSSAEEWSTAARLSLRDSQPSFKALGLATGFVGQGADTLIIDDPYASPQDAYSPVINAKTHAFWSDTAKPRLNDDANVVVMFHRYTENDIAGWLMEQEPDEWELIRYAAISDGDYIHPTTGRAYPDPLGRDEGEKLSPRFSDEWYATQAENAFVWLSQFQGRPTAKEGSFFKVTNLEIVDAAPAVLRQCRGWDLAATEGGGDYTAGVRLGVDGAGIWYVTDVRRGQWGPDDVEKEVRQAARLDGTAVQIKMPQDPGQAGKKQALQFVRMLAGYGIKTESVSGDKQTRAFSLAAQVNAGNVKLVRGEWNRAFIEELRAFPVGRNDDQVDAAADAFNHLVGTGDVEDLDGDIADSIESYTGR